MTADNKPATLQQQTGDRNDHRYFVSPQRQGDRKYLDCAVRRNPAGGADVDARRRGCESGARDLEYLPYRKRDGTCERATP